MTTKTRLIKKLQGGDKFAENELAKIYRPEAVRMAGQLLSKIPCKRIVADEEDIGHDSLVRLLRRIGSGYIPEMTSSSGFLPMLNRFTRNFVGNYLKKQRRQKRYSGLETPVKKGEACLVAKKAAAGESVFDPMDRFPMSGPGPLAQTLTAETRERIVTALADPSCVHIFTLIEQGLKAPAISEIVGFSESNVRLKLKLIGRVAKGIIKGDS